MSRTDHDDGATQRDSVDGEVLVGEQSVASCFKQSVPVAVVFRVVTRTQTGTLATRKQALHLLDVRITIIIVVSKISKSGLSV